jgi:hypothetical protein
VFEWASVSTQSFIVVTKRLPRKLVKDTVGKMEGNLAAIVKSGGGHGTLD